MMWNLLVRSTQAEKASQIKIWLRKQMFSLNQVEIENSDLKIIWIQQKKFFSLTRGGGGSQFSAIIIFVFWTKEKLWIPLPTFKKYERRKNLRITLPSLICCEMNADYPTIIDILLMNAITDILWMGADGPVIIDILWMGADGLAIFDIVWMDADIPNLLDFQRKKKRI